MALFLLICVALVTVWAMSKKSGSKCDFRGVSRLCAKAEKDHKSKLEKFNRLMTFEKEKLTEPIQGYSIVIGVSISDKMHVRDVDSEGKVIVYKSIDTFFFVCETFKFSKSFAISLKKDQKVEFSADIDKVFRQTGGVNMSRSHLYLKLSNVKVNGKSSENDLTLRLH